MAQNLEKIKNKKYLNTSTHVIISLVFTYGHTCVYQYTYVSHIFNAYVII